MLKKIILLPDLVNKTLQFKGLVTLPFSVKQKFFSTFLPFVYKRTMSRVG